MEGRLKRSKLIKKLNPTKTPFYWVFFVIGILIILVGLAFAPFWQLLGKNDSGEFKIPWAPLATYALGFMLAGCIIVYIFWILVKKIKQKGITRNVRILIGVELSLMSVIALFCVLKSLLYTQLEDEKWSWFNTLVILSIVVWVRGAVEMVNAYTYTGQNEQKYPMWYLLMNIGFVTLGPIFLMIGINAKGNVDNIVSWIFTCFLIFGGSMFCVWGGLSKPKKISEEVVEEYDQIEMKQKQTELIEKKEEPQEITEKKEEQKENINEVINEIKEEVKVNTQESDKLGNK